MGATVIGVSGESVGLVTAVRRGASFCWEEEERVEARIGVRRSIVSVIWVRYGIFPFICLYSALLTVLICFGSRYWRLCDRIDA